MDESSVGDVSRINEADTAHLQFKNGQQSFKPENCEIQEIKEVQVQRDAGSPDNTFGVIAEFLNGENVNHVDQTDNEPCSSRQNTNDAGDVVEELTVKTCEGSSMAIVGRSSNRARLEMNRSQFLQRFPLDSDLPGSSSMSKREIDRGMPRRNAGKMSLPETSTKELAISVNVEANEHLTNVERDPVPIDALSNGGIKTKILSQSGFSQFFVKKTLKGKGVTFRGPPHNRSKASNMAQQTVASFGSPLVIANTSAKVSSSIPLASNDVLPRLPSNAINPSSCGNPSDKHKGCGGESEGLSLREWLKAERQKVRKAECLYIFRQIVKHVDASHSQGVVLCDLLPSFFKIFKENTVKYVGSGFQRESFDNNMNKDALSQLENPLVRRQSSGDIGFSSSPAKKQKSNGQSSRQWPMFQRAGGVNIQTENDNGATQEFHFRSSQPNCSRGSLPFTSTSAQLEEKWYASPEQLRDETCSASSNIYSLGILLYEVWRNFDIIALGV